MANVLAFAETRGGELRKVALEAVTAARTLADASGGGEVHALVARRARASPSKAEALGRYGADVVVVVEHAGLERYKPEAAAATAAERLKAGGYRAALLRGVRAGARSRAARRREARRRARLGRDRVRDRRATRSSVKHPAYTGKVIVTLALTGTPAVVSRAPRRACTAAEQPTRPRGSSASQPAARSGGGARRREGARPGETAPSSTSARRR